MTARWKINIALAAFLILAAASALLSLHVQPGNELEAYQKLLRDRGEKLEVAELLPAPATPQENSADAFLDAASMFGSVMDNFDVMRMVGPGRAAVCWRRPDVRGADFTNSWDEYRAYVEGNRPAVNLLHQVLDHPKLDFQIDYSKGSRLSLTHLASMKRATQKLEGTIQLDLHDGDPGAAATNLLTMLAIVQRDYRDDLLIGHLVRIAIANIAVPSTWEFLQATNLTDAQLAAVQNGWEQLNFLKDAENAFALERAWMSAEIERCRASHQSFEELSGGAKAMAASLSGGPSGWESVTEGSRYAIGEVMWRSSWSYSQELRAVKQDTAILEALRSMQTNQSQFYKADADALSARLTALGGTNLSGGLWRALEIPDFEYEFGGASFGTVLRKTLLIETARRVVVTAIGLKRYQLAHGGQYPGTLDELCPAYLASVPIDPFAGKGLKYRPNDDGTFLLYSVGQDGIDDGGDAGPASSSSAGWYWLRSRDWVWPQPATPGEVEFYYEHPLK